MSSPENVAKNFWFDLDYATNPSLGPDYCDVSKENGDAIFSNVNFLFDPVNSPLYKDSNKDAFSPENLNKTRDLASAKPGLIDKMEITIKLILDVMSRNFGKDLQAQTSLELQEKAFIHFGQGTLYDDTINPETGNIRRPKHAMVHMMDGTTDLYFLWHFVLSQYMLSRKLVDNPVLLQLNRYIGLAAEIDFKLEPHQSDSSGVNPKNPSIDDATLSWLKTKWLGNADFNETGEHLRLLVQNFRQRKEEREKGSSN